MNPSHTATPRDSFVDLPLRSLIRWIKRFSGLLALVFSAAAVLRGEGRLPQLQSANGASRSKSRFLTSSEASGGHGEANVADAHAGPCGGHYEDANTVEQTMAFFFFCFAACCVLDHSNSIVPFRIRFPISVVTFLAGMCIGGVFLHVLSDEAAFGNGGFTRLRLGVDGAAHFDPHALLYLLLPPLLYESAQSMSWHTLRKVLPSAAILAVPGVILNTLLTGFFVRAIVRVDGRPPWWRECFLLSSILSATDPVAVVTALAALGAPRKLSTLVEGESLLNDASAVVLAYLARDWSMREAPGSLKECPGEYPLFSCCFRYFCQMSFGGAGIGCACGLVVSLWVTRGVPKHHGALELTIVMLAVYASFFVAEMAKTSGVLASVTFGFVMAAKVKNQLSHDGRHAHHAVFAQIGYLCNQFTFFTAGIVTIRFMLPTENITSCDHTARKPQAWGELIALYFVIHITRTAVVACAAPLLTRLGYGISWKEATFLVYGGLRGAVGLIMGLIVEHNEWIDTSLAQMISFHTSGIVLLTLVVNGSTVDDLYKKLDLYAVNHFKKTQLRKVLARIEGECQKAGIQQLCRDWFFNDCQFEKILRCVPNFRHIKFSDAGLPCPDDVESVCTTLHHLEDSANFRKILKDSTKDLAHRRQSFEQDFEDRWQARKTEAEGRFVQMVESSSVIIDRKDQMINVLNSGDGVLSWPTRDRSSGVSSGCYVSSRSLWTIVDDSKAEMGFAVSLAHLESSHVVVGLIADVGEVRQIELAAGEQVLGFAENSVGFNLTSSEIQFTGPFTSGSVTADDNKSVHAVAEGETVHVSVQRVPGRDWEVVFEVRAPVGGTPPALQSSTQTLPEGAVLMRLSCSFGPFPPTELFPCVEFYGACDVIGNSHITGPVALLQKARTKAFHAAPSARAPAGFSALSGAVAGSAKALSKSVKSGAGAISSLVHREEEAEDMGVDSYELSDGQPDIASSKGSQRCSLTVGAKVTLSFEPVLATDSESINQMFMVLFNTVQSKYRTLHEQGILGEQALFWLTEAVEEATDCAQHEVGSARYSSGDLSREHSEADPSHEQIADQTLKPKKTNVLAERVGELLRRCGFAASSDGKPRSGALARCGIERHVNEVFAHCDTSRQQLIGIMEPLVVEYAVLERLCSKAGFWDCFPESWHRLRMYGYKSTRAKVESLWAFIEAHRHVIADSPAMDRFPALERCLECLVDEARRDIAILQEIVPRRFYYVQHLLALRVLMNTRLAKLKKSVREGWISPEDGAGLQVVLNQRIVEVDRYFPRLHTHFRQDDEDDPKIGTRRKVQEAANAWDDLDIGALRRIVEEAAQAPPASSAGLRSQRSLVSTLVAASRASARFRASRSTTRVAASAPSAESRTHTPVVAIAAWEFEEPPPGAAVKAWEEEIS